MLPKFVDKFMGNSKLKKILIDLGLTENETNAYLSSLSLGPSSILAISRAAQMNRTTLYAVIESLKQKGLMNVEVRGLKKLFVAENPEQLKVILENKKEQLELVLPDFSALYSLRGEDSTIKYYEGLSAVKNVYENILKDILPQEGYLAISDTKKLLSLDAAFFNAYFKKRSKSPISTKLLLQWSEIAEHRKKFENNFNEKIKILPKGTKLVTNLMITPRYIVIHQLTPPISATLIKSPGAVQMGQQLFNIIWNSIKE